MHRLAARASFLIILVSPVNAAAEIYTWQDEKGQQHFSDIPAASTARPYSAHAAPASSDDASVHQRFSQALDALHESTRGTDDHDRQRNATTCPQARNQLATLQSERRLFRTNETGEREAMDAQQRQDLISRTEQFVQENCR